MALGLEASLARQAGRDHKQVAQQRLVFCSGFFERGQVPARDHQQVHGRLGIEVLKRDHRFVLEDDLGSRLAVNDPAEDAILSHSSFCPWSVVSGQLSDESQLSKDRGQQRTSDY